MKNLIFLAVSFFICISFSAPNLHAQEPFLGEVRMFAGDFAPRGWALCNGQLLSVDDHSALFSILSTTYGGDGRTTFALPDLRGRVSMGTGNGPGLAASRLGEKKGSETTTLKSTQIPSITANTSAYSVDAGTPQKFKTGGQSLFTVGNSPNTTAPIKIDGNSQPVNITQPSLGINYIICLKGTYPSRS